MVLRTVVPLAHTRVSVRSLDTEMTGSPGSPAVVVEAENGGREARAAAREVVVVVSAESSPVWWPSRPRVNDPVQPSEAVNPHTHERVWYVMKYIAIRCSDWLCDPCKRTSGGRSPDSRRNLIQGQHLLYEAVAQCKALTLT